MNEFNKKNFQVRNKDMLRSKWHAVNGNCEKFKAVYKRVKCLEKSGENEMDNMKRARQMYPNEHKDILFGQKEA